jgi:hypothetical protein
VTIKKRSARVAVASVALAAGAALVGVGAAVAQSGDTPETEHPSQGKSDEDHGQHLGWAKLIENAGKGLHKGWDQHGQHGGAPAPEPGAASEEESATAPGKSGEPHGQAGDDHGRAGQKGKGAENGEAGQDHGEAGDDHGNAGDQGQPDKQG